jgi:hypothetical protein
MWLLVVLFFEVKVVIDGLSDPDVVIGHHNRFVVIGGDNFPDSHLLLS